MPKRTDIKTILIIGAGPIVIGQACEFDYSGAQACKALREEGYRVVLVNSNPATIMTDPDMADAVYIEPINWQTVEKIIAKERPDALLPTMGGQTALNCALDLADHGVLEKYGVELIGAIARRDPHGRGPRAVPRGDDRDRPGLPEGRGRAHAASRRWRSRPRVGFPTIIRPSFTLGGTGGGIAYNREEFDEIVKRGLELSPTSEVLIEESVLGWKEFEMEVVRDTRGQLHHRLLDREPRPDGRAHRRLDHRRAGADADRQGIPAPARRLDRGAAQDRRRHRRLATCSSASMPKNGRVVVIEMNPRVSRSSALASKATGFPIAKVAAKLAVGYTLDELKNDITGGLTPASFEPTHRLRRHQDPALRVREVPGRRRAPDHADEVGGRGDGDRPHLPGVAAEGAARPGDRQGRPGSRPAWTSPTTTTCRRSRRELKEPGPERLFHIADAFRAGMSRGGRARAVVRRSVVPRPDRGTGRRSRSDVAAGGLDALDAQAPARAQAHGLLRRAPGRS